MAAYGKGQMLGSGINPESFKLDFGGFSRAAEIQAQGLQNLGQSIGGAIQNFGEAKKEQRKVDAYNKASAKSIEAAITLGKSYEIKGVEETLAPFLQSYNDPNLSPIEKAALLDEGKAMIPNVFGRFDKDQAMAIQNAQNAPPPAPSFGFTGTELKKTDRGDIYVLKGNDGRDYDPETKLPISNLGNFGKGLPPEAWSDGATSAADFIDVALNIPSPIADGSPGSLPPTGDVNPLLPPKNAADAAAINAILAGGQLAPPVGEPPASIARPQQEPQYTPRYLAADEVKAEQGTIMTKQEVDALVAQGASVTATPMGNDRFVVSKATLGGKPMVEVNTSQTTQEERAKEMDKALFKEREQLQGAVANKDSIKKMISLIDDGVKTGFAQDAIMKFNRAFGKDVSNAETFKSVSGDVAMGFINLTKGAISDREMTYFTTVLAPNLGNTPEGNKKIGEFMLKAVEKAEKIEKIISEGMRQNKSAFDIDDEIRKIKNADDLIDSSAPTSTEDFGISPAAQAARERQKQRKNKQ
jgi:hypothetical protein